MRRATEHLAELVVGADELRTLFAGEVVPGGRGRGKANNSGSGHRLSRLSRSRLQDRRSAKTKLKIRGPGVSAEMTEGARSGSQDRNTNN